MNTARKLRISSDGYNSTADNNCEISQGVDKADNIQLISRIDPQIRAKVDRVASLEAKIKKVKNSIKEEEKELKGLKAELTDYARENEIYRIDGIDNVLNFTPKVSRHVDVKKLFLFLQRQEKLKTFWNYVNGVIKNLTADYGEQVLEKENII